MLKTKKTGSVKKTSAVIPENNKPIIIGPKFLIPSAVVLILILFIMWFLPRSTGDLFIALAGGRDILSGNLGGPDDWSFSTAGHEWINQNWGSDVLFYTVQDVLGYGGLLGLKLLLIALCAFLIVLAVRKRGVPLAVSVITTSIIMVSSNTYIDLRPNLLTLIFAPLVLWLLYRVAQKQSRIWFVVLAVTVWANMHGGFMFGIGMMLLFTVCNFIASILRDEQTENPAPAKIVKGIKQNWQLAAGTIAAIILSGVLNPFGIQNITGTFNSFNSSLSKNTVEWKPIWENVKYGSVGEFILVVCLLLFILIMRKITSQIKDQPQPVKELAFKRHDINIILFETVLSVVVVVMAVVSRRFIPLAFISLSPIIAVQLWWLIRTTRFKWITVALSVIAISFSAYILMGNITAYYNNKPYPDGKSLFEKMNNVHRDFSPELVKFINDNQISGNAFSSWSWEGYIRWNAPQVKLFIGGRAQQVYTDETLKQLGLIMTGGSPVEALKNNNIHMLALPNDTEFTDLIKKVVWEDKWVPVFVSGSSFLILDPDWKANEAVITRLKNKQLLYSSSMVEKMSLAVSELASDDTDLHSNAIKKLQDILKETPSSWIYKSLGDFMSKDASYASTLEPFLKQELKRLEKADLNNQMGKEILLSRIMIAVSLGKHYASKNMYDKSAEAAVAVRLAQTAYLKMQKKWHV